MEPSPEYTEDCVEVDVTISVEQFSCVPPIAAPKTPTNIVTPMLIRKRNEISGTSIFKKTTFFTSPYFLPQA